MGECEDRNHVGLRKLINKLGCGERVFPDPELGQDVAFVARIVQDHMDLKSGSQAKGEASGLLYKGRPVEELTKEELLEAIKVTHNMFLQEQKHHAQTRDILGGPRP